MKLTFIDDDARIEDLTISDLTLIAAGLSVLKREEQKSLDEGRAFSNSATQACIDQLSEMLEVLL